jgi:hypothetical protein
VATFGRRTSFGSQWPAGQQSFSEWRETVRPIPDADGVTRVFSRELWDDPEIGKTLRECGFAPDDARNILPTAEDYIALFDAARKRLDARAEAFNRDMTMRHGYCRAVPFLVIDHTIWDGEHGAFLYASMKLIGFDDWNVLMLAADDRTREACDLAGHPGTVPAITQVVTERVVEWKRRHELALEAYGITATGGRGITQEQYEAEKDDLRREIVDNVGKMKLQIIAELLRIQS